MLSINLPAPPLLDEAYKLAMKEVTGAVQLLQQILSALMQIEKDVGLGKAVEKAIKDAGKAIETASRTLERPWKRQPRIQERR